MPFRSKRQQRFAFGTGQPWAKRWAKETNFATLPEKKDAGTTAGAMAHGPGGLLATPGLSARPRKWGKKRKSHDDYPDQTQFAGYTMEDWDDTKPDSFYHDMRPRKWGNRKKLKSCTCGVNIATKEQIAPGVTRIHGNLCNVHGRYGPCDAGASKKKPKGRGAPKGRKPAKPKLTPEQRSAARQAEHEANRSKVLSQMGIAPDGQAALDALRKGGQADPGAIARGGFEKAGLVEQAQDGSYRLTASGRATLAAADQGDTGRAGDTISSARDRTGAREQRQAAAQQRKQAAEERRKKAAAARAKKQPSGGGKRATGGSKQPSGPDREAERQQDRARRLAEHAADRKQRQQEHAQDRSQRQLERAADRAAREQERQQRQQEALPTGAQAPRVATRRPLVQYGRNTRATRMKAETYGGIKRSKLDDSVFAGPDRSFPIKTAQDVRDAVRSLGRTKHDKAAIKRGIIRRARAIGATDALPDSWRSEKSFTVFKSGDTYRWLARTTTAYRDRDNEIITTKALEADADRMNASGQYGPLRYWHLGQPNPFDPANPAGPGVDIGDCDYSIVIGRTSIESGTFKSAAIGKAFADSADDYELSPGFFHPIDQPNAAGDYEQIHRFERSVVPIKYGRASNLFTGMTVKEHHMDQQTYDARVNAFLADMNNKGVPPEVAAGALAGMEQADKSAQQQGIAFKSDDPWVAVLAALKAAVVPPQAQPEPEAAPVAVEEKAAGDEATEDPAMEGTPDDMAQDEGDYLGDMNVADFEAMLASALQTALEPLVKGLDIAGKMAGHMDELKAMYGGATAKDDARATEIASLKARLAKLEGDQPAVSMKDAVEAAASDGPQPPPAENGPVIPNDPERPFAGWAVKAFPDLYSGPAAGD